VQPPPNCEDWEGELGPGIRKNFGKGAGQGTSPAGRGIITKKFHRGTTGGGGETTGVAETGQSQGQRELFGTETFLRE